MLLTLVMACAIGQRGCVGGNCQVAPSFGMPSGFGGSPFMGGGLPAFAPGVSYGFGTPYAPVVRQSPRVYLGNATYAYEREYVAPRASVPRTVASQPARENVTVAVPRPVAATPQAVGALPERRPTARPEPAERPDLYPTPGPESPEVPAQGRNPYLPRKAPSVPQEASAGRQAVPVGQAVGSLPRRAVALPTGQVAEVPATAESKAVGMPAGDAPSPVRAANGSKLPNYAVNGMLWNPRLKEGYQASPHPEGHAFIESLQVPEAPVPDLIDDSGKLRVTIISTNPEDRKQAVEDFRKGNGFLSPFKDKVLVRSASPGSWEVKDVGISQIRKVSEGRPGVVMQEPGGRVFYASGKYDQKKAADALRKANPEFDPNKVPGTSSGACPLGFTSDHWPLVIATVVVLWLMFRSRTAQVQF